MPVAAGWADLMNLTTRQLSFKKSNLTKWQISSKKFLGRKHTMQTANFSSTETRQNIDWLCLLCFVRQGLSPGKHSDSSRTETFAAALPKWLFSLSSSEFFCKSDLQSSHIWSTRVKIFAYGFVSKGPILSISWLLAQCVCGQMPA